MIEHVGWLVVWGVIVGVDLVSLGQVMVARPLVAATVAGLIAGDVTAGATVGVLLELFAFEVLPVGAARYPDYGLGAVAAAAAAAGAPLVFGTGVGVGVGLFVAYVGGVGMRVVRLRNAADIARHREAVDGGRARAVMGVHMRSLGRDALRALLVTVLGLGLALVAKRWAPVTLEGAVTLVIVAVGAAAAVAVSGVFVLTGRRSVLRWFVLGLAGGLVGVVLT
jgi:mannose/fructose/N-acetylgalactosamine-specific phosphotransferase system component IIC